MAPLEQSFLESFRVAEKQSDPLIAAALNDPAEDSACIAALEEAEAEQLPLEFQLVDRRVRKFGLHRRVFTTRFVEHGGKLRPELLPRHQLPQLL